MTMLIRMKIGILKGSIILLGLMALLSAVLGHTQELCDPGLEPQEVLPYVVRGEALAESGESSLRCEGFYTSLVSGEPMQLVSLTTAPIQIPPDATDTLVLGIGAGVGTESQWAKQMFSIRAKAFERRTYYRLVAVLSPGQSLRWPLSEVVIPRPELHGRIGVYGFFVDNGTRVYVPVQIGSSQEKTQSGLALVMLAGRDLEDVRWRIRSENPEDNDGEWHDIADVMLTGETIDVDLGLPVGRTLIEFRARDYNSATQKQLHLRVEQ